MTPRATVEAWLDAFADNDMAAAHRLFPDDAVLHSGEPPADHHGFDAALAWFADKRRRAGRDFGYEVENMLTSARYAVALFRLRNADREWRQFAVYRVEDGLIREAWLYED